MSDSSPPGNAPLESASDARDPGRLRILVVDDDSAVAFGLKAALQRKHDVVVVDAGGAAVALFSRDPDFDIVISDVSMPVMDGLELLWQLHAMRVGTRPQLALMTGAALTREQQSLAEELNVPVLAKPFPAERLTDLLSPAGLRSSARR
jgi:CheY-like chemotaxis protein